MHLPRRVIALALAVGAGVATGAPTADANWLSRIAREAGEAGKGAAHIPSHLGPVGKAAAHLKGLASAPKAALAAHATPEGHWQFANREGVTFTAGTPDELQRVLPALAPDAVKAGETKLTLYLSEDTVVRNRAALDQIPADADLHVVTDAGTFALTRGAGPFDLTVRLKPNLTMAVRGPEDFHETLYLLSRPLNKSNIRTLALAPGAPKALSSAPKIDGASKLPAVDILAPEALAQSFDRVRGQTVLVTGRVADGKLIMQPSSGPEVRHDLSELLSAASRNDVNLIILRNETGLQPGGRNWLWQTLEVGGLKGAADGATFGDFLDTLAARRGGFELTTAAEGSGRVQLSAVPIADGAGLAADAANAARDVASNIAGELVSAAVDVHARDSAAQSELDGRLVPGIPTYIQIPYLMGLVAGVLGWATARGWWARIWPAVSVGEANRPTLAWPRRLVRELAYLLVFLPVAGLPAFVWQAMVQFWGVVTAPFRWIRRKFLLREV